MWSLAVVVADLDAEHVLEVAAVEYQQPVEAPGAGGADGAFDDRIRLRRSHRRLDGSDALAAEDLVEGAALLAVTVSDQEADAALAEVEAKVARLPGDPLAGRVPGATPRTRRGGWRGR
jgi:hypothetical protein